MKIIKQISEDEFVVKMEDFDYKPKNCLRIAHDYVQLSGNVALQSDTNKVDKLEGKFAICNNWIYCNADLQVPIRELVKVVLPLLNNHEYCTEKHLLRNDGVPNYTWGEDTLFYKDDVYVRSDGQENFEKISRKVYNYLTNKV